MSAHRSTEQPSRRRPGRGAVRLRLLASLLALGVGVTAVVVALLLVRSVLG